ncbi:hypothetical protein DL769_000486 [Monosporascus sp. CRB-8-3]|nr:hypothetical protein DL769_000486 [Monosporascus sp. CRB-8-3]
MDDSASWLRKILFAFTLSSPPPPYILNTMDGLAAACEGVQVQTGYIVPHPFSVEDDSDYESSVTLADNPTPPAHLDENGPGDKKVGEAHDTCEAEAVW